MLVLLGVKGQTDMLTPEVVLVKAKVVDHPINFHLSDIDIV